MCVPRVLGLIFSPEAIPPFDRPSAIHAKTDYPPAVRPPTKSPARLRARSRGTTRGPMGDPIEARGFENAGQSCPKQRRIVGDYHTHGTSLWMTVPCSRSLRT